MIRFALLLLLAGTLDLRAEEVLLLQPAAVFDGQEMHPGWSVLVRGERIAAAGPCGGGAARSAPDLAA